MKTVCLDTQVLIWGIKEEADNGQDEMISRTKALLQNLEEDDKKILIPSIVIGEFLIRTPEAAYQTIINLIQTNYMVAEYDIMAANHFAKIWNAKKNSAAVESIKESGATRKELIADRMIVATAIANKVECIYSHDNGVAAFGDGFIDVRKVPQMPNQPQLI